MILVLDNLLIKLTFIFNSNYLFLRFNNNLFKIKIKNCSNILNVKYKNNQFDTIKFKYKLKLIIKYTITH